MGKSTLLLEKDGGEVQLALIEYAGEALGACSCWIGGRNRLFEMDGGFVLHDGWYGGCV